MNVKEIKQLVEILESSGLESLSYKDSNFEIELKKSIELSTSQTLDKLDENEYVYTKDCETVCSPLVGVYHSIKDSHGRKVINEGKSIKQGEIIAVIESMKVMNEIKADRDFTICRVLVEEGDFVGFNQQMFLVS